MCRQVQAHGWSGLFKGKEALLLLHTKNSLLAANYDEHRKRKKGHRFGNDDVDRNDDNNIEQSK